MRTNMIRLLIHPTLAIFLVLASVGCAKKKKIENPLDHEAVADLRVISTRSGPNIIATARIPLDDSRPLNYFIVVDGNTLSGYHEYRLPLRPSSGNIRHGLAWGLVPFEAFGEDLNHEAVEATQRGDTQKLRQIADLLKGRISFYYGTEAETYDE
jgi:hypothetical protein